MNVEQLKSILPEYPMSMRLVVAVRGGSERYETTVIEMLLKLMSQPPNTSVTFFGCDNVIIREHAGDGRPETNWLEFDLR